MNLPADLRQRGRNRTGQEMLVAGACVLMMLGFAGCAEEPGQPKFKPVAEARPASGSTLQAAEPAASPPAEEESKQSEGTSPAPASTSDEAATTDNPPAVAQAPGAAAAKEPPFRRRIEIPDFPKGMEWINSKPLSKQDLKGKFVLIDFWTYCCINCIHILPELKKLEKEFANELVVIGVHSAKFETEKEKDNILEAVLRYEIVHPVVNDHEHDIWDSYGVQSWPSVVLIDPEGYAVQFRQGEFKAEEISEVLKEAIPYYKENKLLDDSKPFPVDLEAGKQPKTPLRFPGKVLADEKGNRLFISDSNHNRIVITDLDGKVLDIIGNGTIGRKNGSYSEASFDHPQGCALYGDTLYVADTENHLIRKVDLLTKTVSTIAGIGEQARHAFPGLDDWRLTGVLPERWVGPCRMTALNSPWDLWVHDKNLYIAMAGPHQIWKMPLDESEIGPYAGNGREDIVDGALLPPAPYELGYSSFAQPSGLTSDGQWLFVADSEGSSIRAVPFDPKKQVRTVIGTSHLPRGRLFDFGDVDGPKEEAKLQHALGVTYLDGKIYVADTYNNKIKVVDAETGAVSTFAGTGKPGKSDDPAMFDEPAGITHANGKLYVADTNNHLIRTIDLQTKKVSTLTIVGLPGAPAPTETAQPAPPKPAPPKPAEKKPSFKGAIPEAVPLATLKPENGEISLQVELKIPDGWKVNPLAPMSYWVDSQKETGPIDRAAFGRTKLSKPVADFTVKLPVTGAGDDEINVSLNYYYCQEGDEGVCKIGSVVFTVPIKIADDAKESTASLRHEIPE
jgi:DNA-binding beta-propeller fold protein YncE/cytochrome oxidase Cu insertion factor (SCO1/SenC/PrrC family)